MHARKPSNLQVHRTASRNLELSFVITQGYAPCRRQFVSHVIVLIQSFSKEIISAKLYPIQHLILPWAQSSSREDVQLGLGFLHHVHDLGCSRSIVPHALEVTP